MKKRIAILHGAGYTGGELIRLLLNHPYAELAAVTSRTFADQPVWIAHPALRGQTDLTFSAEIDHQALDAVLIAAEHGQAIHVVQHLLDQNYGGAIVDLSADFRFKDPALYPKWFKYEHPAPELLSEFVYGLPEVYAPYPPGTRFIANPGCFATGLSLALWPATRHMADMQASVTALTGASGSGTRPKSTTHYPTRDGNVRAYKVLAHQHLPEVQNTTGPSATIRFVPVSGPWTRGIWGTAHIALPAGISSEDVDHWYQKAYADKPFVRLTPDELPELRWSVNTPFCDIGWTVQDGHLVVGFAIDNLLKGAASQAVHNLNLVLNFPETAGLIPASTSQLQEAH